MIVQRLVELVIAKNHAKEMFKEGAVEIDKSGYKFIVFMHISFFIFLILEFILLNRSLNIYWYIFAVIFILAQVLRYWAIKSLGIFWNTKIIVLKGSEPVKKGPYRYIRHPNYTAVAAEILTLPLIFSCYFTAMIFTILNLFVLRRRIKIERAALLQN